MSTRAVIGFVEAAHGFIGELAAIADAGLAAATEGDLPSAWTALAAIEHEIVVAIERLRTSPEHDSPARAAVVIDRLFPALAAMVPGYDDLVSLVDVDQDDQGR